MRTPILILSIIAALAACGLYMVDMDNNPELVVGKATDGHHQIIDDCSACHTTAFPTADDIQNSCITCHADEVAEEIDSHPMRVFNDPRSYLQLEKLDATQCITCHGEHNLDETFEMGVKLPGDMCLACHEEVETDVPSHSGFEFTDCLSSGCHNYHNNTALNESFLLKHAGEPLILPNIVAGEIVGIKQTYQTITKSNPTCKKSELASGDQSSCSSCHKAQANSFTKGRHGMAHGAMTPGNARLQMKSESSHKELTCNSCHEPNEKTTQVTSDTCMSCHDDDHSNNFSNSKHSKLLVNGNVMECSTCHMPTRDGITQHNQSANIRPIENMIQSTCSDCHGLQFTLDSLADPAVLKSNFSQAPINKVPSIEMAVKKQK